MQFLVLGAGLQGTSCAFDLLRNADVTQVRLADRHLNNLPPFLAPELNRRLVPVLLDVQDHRALAELMRESDAVACALPYYFNLEMTRCAIANSAHFCDLGGNTDIVLEQKGLHATALAASRSVIPDCGLAPGMVNILAQQGIDEMDSVESVKMYVGGLPRHPVPPLNYQLVYSMDGMLDYYTTRSRVLRGGLNVEVEALSEVEEVSFSAPPHKLEAFHTAGGLSTMALRFERSIQTMEYKTLRYPGHAEIFRAIRGLGLLDSAPLLVNGLSVVPRQLFIAAAEPHLRKPGSPDIVVLRVVVDGLKKGVKWRVLHELVDGHDQEHGISAMMRTTGYSLAITALMQARGLISALGVHTPDECVPAGLYMQELKARGIDVKTTSGAA